MAQGPGVPLGMRGHTPHFFVLPGLALDKLTACPECSPLSCWPPTLDKYPFLQTTSSALEKEVSAKGITHNALA